MGSNMSSWLQCRSTNRRFYKILFVLVFCKLVGAFGQEDIDEYVYDDIDALDSDKGTRLVGASLGHTNDLPFLVGYHILGDVPHQSGCTGSLITRQYVITAAHCIVTVLPTEMIDKCLKSTKRGIPTITRNKRSFIRYKVTCERYVDGSIKMNLLEPNGKAFVGVDNIRKFSSSSQGEMIPIDFVVRHAKSYRGGSSYGRYGGYDIALIHLEHPVSKSYKPACLPSPNLKDNGIGSGYGGKTSISLAGYGMYFRRNCITDSYGPSKFHYCAAKGRCKLTNPPISEECKAFFNNPNTPNRVPAGDTDLIIRKRSTSVYCYNNASALPDSKGWCHIDNDLSRLDSVVDAESWGFCSRDCYLDKNWQNPLRRRDNVDILSDKLCRKFLHKSLGSYVKVYPKILCIGARRQLKYSVWTKGANGYKQIPKRSHPHKLELFKGSNMYVHSVGTCNGDSGGPVFIKNKYDNRFVVLGAVSGGRGPLGDCGGMNNPTHYARVSAFRRWFKIILGKEIQQVCWSDGKKAKFLNI